MPDPKKSKNIIFSPWGSENIQNIVAQPVRTPELPKCLFWLKWPKCPWSTLGLTEGQNPHKTTFFIILHQTRASRRFLTTSTKFDLKSIPSGPKNPNFDQAVRTGWNQCYCKVYQIIIPMTIHGLKSVLEWSRCPKNWDNVPIDAPLNFESHNFWPDYWIFKIHTFSKTESQDLSRHVKIKPIRGSLKVAAL